jgi:methyl-accepting chemotaxis protein
MTEQAAGMTQIASAADGMRTQSEQVSRAVTDQSKAMREMTSAAQNTARQIKLITKANLEHSTAAAALLTSVEEIRKITDRNASGVKQTRGGTDDLLRRAQALTALVERPAAGRGANGRSPRSRR